jgi:hypothetical protein
LFQPAESLRDGLDEAIGAGAAGSMAAQIIPGCHPVESSERRGTVSQAVTLQKPLPRSAPWRTIGQTITHADHLRRVPSTASRRRHIASIELCRDSISGQRGELLQDRPEPLGAICRRSQKSMSAKHMHAPRAHQAICGQISLQMLTSSLSKMRINRVPDILQK